jgi:hypothetical protein
LAVKVLAAASPPGTYTTCNGEYDENNYERLCGPVRTVMHRESGEFGPKVGGTRIYLRNRNIPKDNLEGHHLYHLGDPLQLAAVADASPNHVYAF